MSNGEIEAFIKEEVECGMAQSGLNEELYGKEITITERVVFIEEEDCGENMNE